MEVDPVCLQLRDIKERLSRFKDILAPVDSNKCTSNRPDFASDKFSSNTKQFNGIVSRDHVGCNHRHMHCTSDLLKGPHHHKRDFHKRYKSTGCHNKPNKDLFELPRNLCRRCRKVSPGRAVVMSSSDESSYSSWSPKTSPLFDRRLYKNGYRVGDLCDYGTKSESQNVHKRSKSSGKHHIISLAPKRKHDGQDLCYRGKYPTSDSYYGSPSLSSTNFSTSLTSGATSFATAVDSSSFSAYDSDSYTDYSLSLSSDETEESSYCRCKHEKKVSSRTKQRRPSHGKKTCHRKESSHGKRRRNHHKKPMYEAPPAPQLNLNYSYTNQSRPYYIPGGLNSSRPYGSDSYTSQTSHSSVPYIVPQAIPSLTGQWPQPQYPRGTFMHRHILDQQFRQRWFPFAPPPDVTHQKVHPTLPQSMSMTHRTPHYGDVPVYPSVPMGQPMQPIHDMQYSSVAPQVPSYAQLQCQCQRQGCRPFKHHVSDQDRYTQPHSDKTSKKFKSTKKHRKSKKHDSSYSDSSSTECYDESSSGRSPLSKNMAKLYLSECCSEKPKKKKSSKISIRVVSSESSSSPDRKKSKKDCKHKGKKITCVKSESSFAEEESEISSVESSSKKYTLSSKDDTSNVNTTEVQQQISNENVEDASNDAESDNNPNDTASNFVVAPNSTNIVTANDKDYRGSFLDGSSNPLNITDSDKECDKDPKSKKRKRKHNINTESDSDLLPVFVPPKPDEDRDLPVPDVGSVIESEPDSDNDLDIPQILRRLNIHSSGSDVDDRQGPLKSYQIPTLNLIDFRSFKIDSDDYDSPGSPPSKAPGSLNTNQTPLSHIDEDDLEFQKLIDDRLGRINEKLEMNSYPAYEEDEEESTVNDTTSRVKSSNCVDGDKKFPLEYGMNDAYNPEPILKFDADGSSTDIKGVQEYGVNNTSVISDDKHYNLPESDESAGNSGDEYYED